jgi:N6-adenosine-specific RNA methylase IME4
MTDHLPAVRRLISEGHGDRHIAGALGVTRHVARGLIVKAQLAAPSAVTEIDPQTAAEFAERIAGCWRKSFEGIVETGRWLVRAKDALEHGEWTQLIEHSLPFKPHTAQRLMAISRDERITNPAHVRVLPNAWGTLYELTKLDDTSFQHRITDGTIRPDMERRDIATAVKATRRAARESHLGEMQAATNLKLPDKRYGVILADPEWRFEPWSRSTGLDRAADNHYPTSVTEVIAARPVQDIAAKDCALFLWATVPMLPHALAVMEAWGFEYRTNWAWGKDRIGTGYWNRNRHEHFLLGIRGNVPAPAPGDQWDSLLEAPIGQHSEKPDRFYDLIEDYFPNLPRIELNARRSRQNWDAWGLDAAPHDPETGEVTEAAE